MSKELSAIASKVWNYAHVLKNAGVGYGDYPIPTALQWSELSSNSGGGLEGRTTAIDHLESVLDRQITRSNHLRQASLVAAFSGKL